jgi:aminoglycoside N3'-acetyltransferase
LLRKKLLKNSQTLKLEKLLLLELDQVLLHSELNLLRKKLLKNSQTLKLEKLLLLELDQVLLHSELNLLRKNTQQIKQPEEQTLQAISTCFQLSWRLSAKPPQNLQKPRCKARK